MERSSSSELNRNKRYSCRHLDKTGGRKEGRKAETYVEERDKYRA